MILQNVSDTHHTNSIVGHSKRWVDIAAQIHDIRAVLALDDWAGSDSIHVDWCWPSKACNQNSFRWIPSKIKLTTKK